jgi:hypothetical protein
MQAWTGSSPELPDREQAWIPDSQDLGGKTRPRRKSTSQICLRSSRCLPKRKPTERRPRRQQIKNQHRAWRIIESDELARRRFSAIIGVVGLINRNRKDLPNAAGIAFDFAAR